MPVVPFTKAKASVQPTMQQPQQPQADPNFLLMAAAMMHREGRLYDQPNDPKEKVDGPNSNLR